MGLGDIFSSGPGIRAAAKKKKGIIKTARKTKKEVKQEYAETRAGATGAIDKYTGLGAKALAPALTNLGEVYNQEQMGRGAYFDILGLGGQAGADRAQERFDTSLQMPTHLAEQSILRNNAAAGGLRSGGTSTDLADYTREQVYTPYVNRFQQFNPLEAATAQGNLASNLASLYGNAGANTAQAYVNTNPATALLNIGNTIGQARGDYAGDVFGAQQGALANQWGALSRGLELGGQALGAVASMPVGGNTVGGKLMGKVFA